MINESEIYLSHYCHPACEPFMNIMRLPKDEAFALAARLAEENREQTAFWRFADFVNYYPLREAADTRLYKMFTAAGGKPVQRHPLSFVLQGSAYLREWFGSGRECQLALSTVPEDSVSFTYGDSSASLGREGTIKLITKRELLADMGEYENLTAYMKHIETTCHYIEAQVWDDTYIASAYINSSL